MPTHDIIDNRSEKLVDHVNRILGSTEAARFAVGFFFLSGLTSIAEKLAGVKELKLLIGNRTNRETLEQIAEGYRRLELVAEKLEEQAYPKRSETKRMATDASHEVRLGMEAMDQTDEGEKLIRSLAQMIEERRVKVKVYTKGRLHAKAYIFDYGKVFDGHGKAVERHEQGIAVVGSSNLTLSGVTSNTELNVVVQGNENHRALGHWFDELWDESQDFDEALMQEMKQSWAMADVRPYDIYLKTLYELVKDRLDGTEDREILWDDEITTKLADFQKTAVRNAVQMIRRYGGAFVADVVGLGKSYIGAAIVKHFERTEHARPLIVCPAALKEMWDRYNAVYHLGAQVLSMGFLKEDDDGAPVFLLEDERYRKCDFVLVDESHNLRAPDTQRYKVMQSFLATGKSCCFLTATPRNKSAWDVYHQIKLFHPDDRTDLPVDPPDLRKYFKLVEKGERKLPDLLFHVQIRRLRRHVLRWYGYTADTQRPLSELSDEQAKPYLDEPRRAYVLVAGRHQFFPKRELETIEYSIEDTYQGLYQELRGYLGKSRKGQPAEVTPGQLTYARYGLWHYVRHEKQHREPYVDLQHAGANLRGLIRILLFKRFESSVYAFRETVKRLLKTQQGFLDALKQGFVPAGEEAQAILYEPNEDEERDLMDALRKVSGKYKIEDFDVERMKRHIEHDVKLLGEILKKVEPITADKDAKLQTLKKRLGEKPLNEGKRLIFTQYADTARYLWDNLNPKGKRDDIEVIYSGDKSKVKVVGRFAPKANPEYRLQGDECELMTLIATDVLAEGLNLQDCDKIVNYDLHWNPVRLIQRFGRIDRIGSEHVVVYGYNFLPETGIEKNLGLHEKLMIRIQEIHDTIGEDSQILDPSEQLNVEAMYAIYEQTGKQLSLFDAEDEPVDLNEAEEMLKRMRRDEPTEYERIVNLRDGIRTARPATVPGLFVFCAADRYQQLFLLNQKGGVVSKDIARVLGAIKCGHELRGMPLPPGYNQAVMRVMRDFAEEVKHRESERKYSTSLTHGQQYVQRELGLLFRNTKDEDEKGRINLLEKAFCGPVTGAIRSELNRLRRNAVTGEALLKTLGRLYELHNMREWEQGRRGGSEQAGFPRVVCSEGLV